MAALIQLGAPTSNMNILTQIPQILVWLFAFNAFLEGTHSQNFHSSLFKEFLLI